MEDLQTLRNNFAASLQQTNNEIGTLQNQLKMLELKREQLKGAVYALDTAMSNAAQQTNSAPVEQDETKKTEGEQNG